MAKLEDYTIGFELGESAIKAMILNSTIEHAFGAAERLMYVDGVRDARVLEDDGGVVLEVSTACGELKYFSVPFGSTIEAAFRCVVQSLNEGR